MTGAAWPKENLTVKKILSVILAATMILAFNIVAFAEPAEPITNLSDGATFDVTGHADVNEFNYTEQVYSVTIEWQVDSSAQSLVINTENVYKWNPGQLKYEEKTEGSGLQKWAADSDTTIVGVSIVITNKSNAAIGYKVEFDGSNVTEGLQVSNSLSGGDKESTVASADTAVGTKSSSSEDHAFELKDFDKITETGSAQSTTLPDSLSITLQSGSEISTGDLALGSYTITLSAAE